MAYQNINVAGYNGTINNLTVNGTLTAGTVNYSTSTVGNLYLSGSTLSSTSGSLTLSSFNSLISMGQNSNNQALCYNIYGANEASGQGLIIGQSTGAYGLNNNSTNSVVAQFQGTTYTDTSSTGTQANLIYTNHLQPSVTCSNAGVTYTNASTVYIGGPPTASSTVNLPTITNPYALYIASGNVSIASGTLSVSSSITIAGTAGVTFNGSNGNGTVSVYAGRMHAVVNGSVVYFPFYSS